MNAATSRSILGSILDFLVGIDPGPRPPRTPATKSTEPTYPDLSPAVIRYCESVGRYNRLLARAMSREMRWNTMKVDTSAEDYIQGHSAAVLSVLKSGIRLVVEEFEDEPIETLMLSIRSRISRAQACIKQREKLAAMRNMMSAAAMAVLVYAALDLVDDDSEDEPA